MLMEWVVTVGAFENDIEFPIFRTVSTSLVLLIVDSKYRPLFVSFPEKLCDRHRDTNKKPIIPKQITNGILYTAKTITAQPRRWIWTCRDI